MWSRGRVKHVGAGADKWPRRCGEQRRGDEHDAVTTGTQCWAVATVTEPVAEPSWAGAGYAGKRERLDKVGRTLAQAEGLRGEDLLGQQAEETRN
jgi:hypothetical protein